MAATHLIYDSTFTPFRQAAAAVIKADEARAELIRATEAMLKLADGTASTAADFDLLASQGSVSAGDYATANDAAKAFYDEVAALKGKMTGEDNTSPNAQITKLRALLAV